MSESVNQQVTPNPVPKPEIPVQGGDFQIALQSGDKAVNKVKLEDLPEEHEYDSTEYEKLIEMYNLTMSDFVEGELVSGKILAINEKEVSVDIGFKSEGTIPIEEFSSPETLKIGDDIEVFLDEIEDKEGQLVLSKKKADFMRIWDKICKSYESSEVLQGKCIRRIKGGIVVDLMGVDAFLPGSQIDVKPIRDFDAFIGKSLDLKVVKVNNLRKNIVVSHRVLVEQEIAGQRQRILDELQRNQVLEGTVKNITDFGVFIDLGGVDGLLHINDLSWGRVNHPSEVVQLDEKLKVMVLDFNDQKDRISLGLKQLQPHPWENVEEKYPVGSHVRGRVVSISDYGAFVELEKGVEGLIHISEMSWTQHIKHPSKVVNVGETIEAAILNIEKNERKISLGLKQLEPDPWETLEVKYPVGSRHQGKVRNLTNFGAFIELEEGIDGLVHISDLSWTKKIRHPSEVLKKGASVDVVVLNVDRDNRRISLGYKQTNDSPWEFFEDKYRVGTMTAGIVVRLIEKGLIVELPDMVDGFVPISHLSKQVSKPADGYQVDDRLDLRVIEFNKENKKIVLSEKRAKEAQAASAEKEAAAAPIIEEVIDIDLDKELAPDSFIGEEIPEIELEATPELEEITHQVSEISAEVAELTAEAKPVAPEQGESAPATAATAEPDAEKATSKKKTSRAPRKKKTAEDGSTDTETSKTEPEAGE
ncbi:30S ribosomal protein S1 [candidate division KSB1 bacterium]|nr:30S ribosomal protein S1 [candidate division KSB1 bacterium]